MARIKPVLKLKDLEAEKNKIKSLFLNTEPTDLQENDESCASNSNLENNEKAANDCSEPEESEYDDLVDPDLYFSQAMQSEANNELDEAIDFYSLAIESK